VATVRLHFVTAKNNMCSSSKFRAEIVRSFLVLQLTYFLLHYCWIPVVLVIIIWAMLNVMMMMMMVII